MPALPSPFPGVGSSRRRNLRLLAHTRRIALVMLPLGAAMGLLVAVVVRGAARAEVFLARGVRAHPGLYLMPVLGLFLAGFILERSGVGEVSLAEDIHLGHHEPYRAFPFRRSLVKVLACVATIGCGGSAGLEGPAKWLGGAAGLQVHRLIRQVAQRVRRARHLLMQPLTVVTSGAAGALAAVFRAPVSGALFAAEQEGHIGRSALISALVASATGYLAFAAVMGTAPLLGSPHTYRLAFTEVLLAFPLGFAAGLAATAFRALQGFFRRVLAPVPLRWRGAVGGLGVALLLVPGSLLWPELRVTQGGGVELVRGLLEVPPTVREAVLFFGLKLFATALTLGCGGVGGTWLPCVAMGACLGAGFDAALSPAHPGLLALMGATAMAGAFNDTVLVPVVFLAETTAQGALVVPALVATVVAFLVARESEG